MLDINVNNIANNQLQPVLDDLYKRNPIETSKEEPSLASQILNKDSYAGVGFNPLKIKPSAEVKVPISEGYTLVGDEYLRKFPTYEMGRDNAEYAAQQQSAGEKWANGIRKFGAKTLNAVVGGTLGIVYGIEEAITDQKLSSLYDNDFSNWLSDLDTKMNYTLPNYYSKDVQNMNFGQQLVGDTANFLSDKFLGGLAFTAGALGSEAIWAWATGGTSLATSGARWGAKLGRMARWGVEGVEDTAQILSGVSKMKSIYKTLPGQLLKAGTISKSTAVGLAKAGEFTSAVGFMARSAGYEASVEALQYKKEQEEKFYTNFASLNGREPNADDIAQFNKDLESGANTVFGMNMGILGVSNLAMFGNIMNIKNPIKTGLADFIDKKAFGYGIEKTAEGTFKALERTRAQKITRGVFNYVAKPAFTEGLFEEGGQGVATKYNSKWLEHTYDPKLTKENFDSIGAFQDSLKEQYGTKEGWVENGLGILIGIVGGSINARSEEKQKQGELKYKADVANVYNTTTLQGLILPSKIQSLNRAVGFATEAKEQAEKGNIVESELAKKGSLLSYINANQVLGMSTNDMLGDIQKSMEVVTPEQWAEAGVEDVEAYKAEALTEVKDLATQWKTNKKYVQYIIGEKLVGEQELSLTGLDGIVGDFGTNASIVEALAYQLTIGENANKLMEDTRVTLSKIVGEEHSRTLDTLKSLEEDFNLNKTELKTLQNKNRALKTASTKLTNAIAKLDSLEVTDAQKKRRAELSSQLLEVETQLAELNQRATEISENLSTNKLSQVGLDEMDTSILSTSFSSKYVSTTDVLNLDESIAKFEATIDSLNPQMQKYVTDLLNEYNKAKDIFSKAQITNRIISSKDFKLQNIGSFIGGKIAKNKVMNKDSKEWLQDALDDYAKNIANVVAVNSLKKEETSIVEIEEDFTKTKPYTKRDSKKIEELQQKKQNIEKNKEKELKNLISKKSISRGNVSVTNKYSVDDIKKRLIKEGKVHHSLSNDKSIIQKIYYTLGLKDFNTVSKEKHVSIIDKLLPYLQNTNVYEFSDETNLPFAGFASGQDIFLGKKSGTNLEVLSHELLHVVTVRGMREGESMYDINFKKEMDILYKLSKNSIKEDFYGLTNEKELISEAFANPVFAKALSEVKQQNGENVLNGLINNITKFHKKQFNVDVKDTLLESIVTSVDNHLEKYGNEYKKLEEGKLTAEGILKYQLDRKIKQVKEDITNTRDTFNKQIKKIDEEISRIEKKYNKEIERIEEEKQEIMTSTASPLEQYKQRLETLLKTRYKDLVSETEGSKPTKEEIELFRDGKADDALKAKLSQWKLYDASIDEDGVSVADLITLIEQLDSVQQTQDTKTEVTTSEAWQDLKDDEGSEYNAFKPELGINQTAPATIKKNKTNGTYELTHIKPLTIIQKLGGTYKLGDKNKGKDIENLKPGDTFEVDGFTITYEAGGRLVMGEQDFKTREEVLNMFVIATNTIDWSFIDVYENVGEGLPMQKVSSDFQVDLNNSAVFNNQKGDRLTLHVKNTSGYSSKEGDNFEQFEIFLRDKNGDDVNVLKANKTIKGEFINQRFLALRQEAYNRWERAGKPEIFDLDMSVEIDQVLIGSPELHIIGGQITDIAPSARGIEKEVIAKGFILDGEVTTDNTLPSINLSYVNKISKNNPGLKQPFVVVKRGAHNIAVPISLVKQAQPVDFDGIYNSTKTPQQKVLEINEAIIENAIETDKIVFEDIYDEQKMQQIREAFQNKKVFVTADRIADKKYRKENLANDATIKIDLDNLDRVFNAGKIKIRLDDSIQMSTSIEGLEDYGINLTKQASDLADQIYDKVYTTTDNASDKARNKFLEIIIDGVDGVIPNRAKGISAKNYLEYRTGLNTLIEANKYYKELEPKIKDQIGKELAQNMKTIILRYEMQQKELAVRKEEIKEGLNNTDCK